MISNISPLGINLKDSDRDVKDGSLQESINVQWRDGAMMPIPNRVITDISMVGFHDMILHKVDDENKINVLAFSIAEDYLTFIGVITDGVYEANIANIIVVPFVKYTNGMTYTILNGIIYFMGDGSSVEEQYYLSVRYGYGGIGESYYVEDMYEWKTLIPYLKFTEVTTNVITKTHNSFSNCGVICIRYALVLNSGEVVLHSPIFPFQLFAINTGSSVFVKDDALDNIHTIVSLELAFEDLSLFNKHVSAINIYASVPFYKDKFDTTATEYDIINILMNADDAKGTIQEQAESNFYLVKTIKDPGTSTDKLLLYVNDFDSEIEFPNDTLSKVDIGSIAAGELMPVDDFSHHYRYGSISSFNGRIVIKNPTTVMGKGNLRYFSNQIRTGSRIAYNAITEDGVVSGIHETDKVFTRSGNLVYVNGVISYPDYRADKIGFGTGFGTSDLDPEIRYLKGRKNAYHNMSCSFDIKDYFKSPFTMQWNGSLIVSASSYLGYLTYSYDEISASNPALKQGSYSSKNMVQFSSAGEFKTWPVLNAYRIGEGKVMSVGSNSVDPANADAIASLIIGTSDGMYTANLDPSGNNFIASITRAKKTPFISEETLEIDGSLIFVSDKGLMAAISGEVVNLTEDYFPSFGNGDFPQRNIVYPNYDLLSTAYPNEPYDIVDIATFMKSCIFAFDGRRGNIWCSNKTSFSLVYNVGTKLWSKAQYYFTEKAELFDTIVSDYGSIYSRFLVVGNTKQVSILSGEQTDNDVAFLMLTRPVKINGLDSYKKINRMFMRCELYKDESIGNFNFGIWGKQDLNRNKVNIPLVAIVDDSSYVNNIRQDIGIGSMKGKYKAISFLLSGIALPNSKIYGFEIDHTLVDNIKIR